MKRYNVVWEADALTDLKEIGDYIGRETGYWDRAEAYVLQIFEFAMRLETAPGRGTARDDLWPGLRTVPFKRSVVLAILVDEEAGLRLKIMDFGGEAFYA